MNAFLLSQQSMITALWKKTAVKHHSLSGLFILSVSDGVQKAKVTSLWLTETNNVITFENLFEKIQKSLVKIKQKFDQPLQYCKLEWITTANETTWSALQQELKRYKRNYFRSGLAFEGIREAWLPITEMELNANACLYAGNDVAQAAINKNNLATYFKARHGSSQMPSFTENMPLQIFQTAGVFFDITEGKLHCLSTQPRQQGRRELPSLSVEMASELIGLSSRYLGAQVQADGRYVYGHFPCFGRQIGAYNMLRHASSTYALIEGYEACQKMLALGEIPSEQQISGQPWRADDLPAIKQQIDSALSYLQLQGIRYYSGGLAYVVDEGNIIKLGANAVAILALVKYVSVFTEHPQNMEKLALAEKLAAGIVEMQQADGSFVHVLDGDTLALKEKSRIIYYDGEAAFGLMRLYGITGDARWLACVEKAFDYFIEAKHERAHDHWLSYCSNELVQYKPEKKYFAFAVRNVRGYVDFIKTRITTFPTLLELSMAFHKMLLKLDEYPQFADVLDGFDVAAFYQALHARANYLLNGFFFPEMAMFFKYPKSVLHGFFIRHHSFRVRIDDVEHYLSGLVAYWEYCLRQNKMPKIMNIHRRMESPSKPHSSAKDIKKGVLAWGGDVNLGRRQHYRTVELGLKNVLNIPELTQADLSVVNLECVVSTLGEQGADKGEGGPYYFRARPEMLNVLMESGINVVAVANNHSGDYGIQAQLQQRELLKRIGIAEVGFGENIEQAFQPIFCQVNELQVAIFNVDATQHRFAASIEKAGNAYLSLKDAQKWYQTFKPRIEKARQEADVVMFAVHWGQNHVSVPSADEIAVGHALIDAGADAILGASSHRLQGMEIYKGKPIIHDAGDLLFDAVGNTLSNGGVFRLGLSQEGVDWVEFIPIGVGFGFTRRLHGDAAQKSIASYQQLCEQMGTSLQCGEESAFVALKSSAKPTGLSTQTYLPVYQSEVLTDYRPDVEYGQVEYVPEDAKIKPIDLNGLTLLGVRIKPHRLTVRSMLWVETWWMCKQQMEENLRLSITAVRQGSGQMPEWGRSMDHDPCDWMQPTSNWQTGKIYRDFYGLRPPQLRQIENKPLQLHIRVLGNQKENMVYQHPQLISLAITGAKTGLSLVYKTDFSNIDLTVPIGQTWTAEQLAKITGGRWLVEPDKDWFVRSVVNGKKFIGMRDAPVLFVAHTSYDRAFHESMPVPKSIGDRHTILAAEVDKLAGAIVSKPMPNLPKNFPLLLVEDPIKGLIEIGLAARQRFKKPVIAVTGTAGKSSTIQFLEALFGKNRCLKSLDNYNSRVGVPAQLASLSPEHEAALLEVAISALWMQRGPITRQIKPTVALITNIGAAHVRKGQTLDDVARYKSRIFDGVDAGGAAVVCRDIEQFELIAQQAEKYRLKLISYGEHPAADIRLIAYQQGRGEIEMDEQRYVLTLSAIGKHMMLNALSALAVAKHYQMPLPKMIERLQNCQILSGRGERFSVSYRGNVIDIYDDAYNANPLSMKAALQAFADNEAMPEQRILVLGDMLELGEEATKHHLGLVTDILQTQARIIILCGAEMQAVYQALQLQQLKATLYWQPDASAVKALFENNSIALNNKDQILFKSSNGTGLHELVTYFRTIGELVAK